MYANFAQVNGDLVGLIDAVEILRSESSRQSCIAYESQDARQVAFDTIQCNIGACRNWIQALASLRNLLQKSSPANWETEYLGSIGSRLRASQAEDLMLDYLRNTLVLKVHFAIENLFGNILRAINATPTRSGFWHTCNAMLEQAGFPTDGHEKKVLNAMASLRNSFHSNGMHTKDSFEVEIDLVKFDFRNGHPVECASWFHIVKVVRASISVLSAIVLSERVRSIQGEIVDAFASHSNQSDPARGA